MKNTGKRILTPEELMPEYEELLRAGAVLPLVVSGGSMLPFLAPGRDTVYLKAIDRPLRRGDIVFYRRADGRYILHRLHRIDGEKCWFVGDAQDDIEGPLNIKCAFAYVTEALRKGKTQKPGCICWDFFENIWPLAVGSRKGLISLYSRIRSK